MGQAASRRKKRRKVSPPPGSREDDEEGQGSYGENEHNQDHDYGTQASGYAGRGSGYGSSVPIPKAPRQARPVSTFDPEHGLRVEHEQPNDDDLYAHEDEYRFDQEPRSRPPTISRGVNGGIHIERKSSSVPITRNKKAPHYAYPPELTDHSSVLRGLDEATCRKALDFVYSKCNNHKKALCVSTLPRLLIVIWLVK